jgi:Predicted membrane protein (DUF2142)
MMVFRTSTLPSDRVTSRTPWTVLFSKVNERHFVLALCCLAAIRVFVYSAAFPFFNNVDEGAHFDLVLKYSHGFVPRKLDPASVEMSNYVMRYGSLEYNLKPPQRPLKSPVSAAPEHAKDNGNRIYARPDSAEAIQTKATVLWGVNTQSLNHESSQAPLYYTLAALWLRLGQLLGMSGAGLLYWIRFLNVFLAGALVWLGFVAARLIFPEDRFVRLGVPVLLTVLPQDIFYSIQNDVLSPLCCGMAFIGSVRWLRTDVPSAKLALGTGLSLAAAYLNKISNLPLVAVAALALLIHAWCLSRSGKLAAASSAFALLLVSAALPIMCWTAWNVHNFGDLTGSGPKIRMLGWTRKPVSQWLNHPIFTLRGSSYFWSELMASFWRGEFVWGMKRLALPAADVFYWSSSIILLGAAMMVLFPRFALASKPQRDALWVALSTFAASVAYLVLLSVAFDYGGCMYPSRTHPYFTSGRLLAGTLIPFFLLYLYGLKWITQRVNSERLLWWILAGMVVFIAGSQIAVDRVVFPSQWNWFHLVMGFG